MPRKECDRDSAKTSRPKIAYHTCSMQNFFDIIYMGIFQGGMGDRQSFRGHAYLTVVPPWDRHGRKAGGARADRPINMLVQLGCRLYAPGDGEALVTEDWITNKVIIYADDAEYARLIWSNRMYVNVRRKYQDSIKTFREETQQGVSGTPVLESPVSWGDAPTIGIEASMSKYSLSNQFIAVSNRVI